MEEKFLEKQLLFELKNKFQNLNFVGSDFEKVGNNPYYLQVYKYPNCNEYEVSVIRYNSEPQDSEETNIMNSIYEELIYNKLLIVSHLSRPPYRNYIGTYDNSTGRYVFIESSIIQFYINFKLREEQL